MRWIFKKCRKGDAMQQYHLITVYCWVCVVIGSWLYALYRTKLTTCHNYLLGNQCLQSKKLKNNNKKMHWHGYLRWTITIIYLVTHTDYPLWSVKCLKASSTHSTIRAFYLVRIDSQTRTNQSKPFNIHNNTSTHTCIKPSRSIFHLTTELGTIKCTPSALKHNYSIVLMANVAALTTDCKLTT